MKTSLLIVDGDRWQRETVAAALAYEGWHAEHTGECASAMALLARHRFQLVLFDPSSPATGGWATVKRLSQLHPELPVIVLRPEGTGMPSVSIAGQISFMRKPIDFPTLLASIERVLLIPTESPMTPRPVRTPTFPSEPLPRD